MTLSPQGSIAIFTKYVGNVTERIDEADAVALGKKTVIVGDRRAVITGVRLALSGEHPEVGREPAELFVLADRPLDDMWASVDGPAGSARWELSLDPDTEDMRPASAPTYLGPIAELVPQDRAKSFPRFSVREFMGSMRSRGEMREAVLARFGESASALAEPEGLSDAQSVAWRAAVAKCRGGLEEGASAEALLVALGEHFGAERCRAEDRIREITAQLAEAVDIAEILPDEGKTSRVYAEALAFATGEVGGDPGVDATGGQEDRRRDIRTAPSATRAARMRPKKALANFRSARVLSAVLAARETRSNTSCALCGHAPESPQSVADPRKSLESRVKECRQALAKARIARLPRQAEGVSDRVRTEIQARRIEQGRYALLEEKALRMRQDFAVRAAAHASKEVSRAMFGGLRAMFDPMADTWLVVDAEGIEHYWAAMCGTERTSLLLGFAAAWTRGAPLRLGLFDDEDMVGLDELGVQEFWAALDKAVERGDFTQVIVAFNRPKEAPRVEDGWTVIERRAFPSR